MIDENTINILNNVYKTYNDKCLKLVNLLNKKYEASYTYSNLYSNNSYYPLPLIEVKKICLIVFKDNEIDIISRISKNKALKLDYEKMIHYDFDIYPIDDYYNDLYIKGMPIEELKNNIANNKNNIIGFTFIVSLDFANEKLMELIDLLKNNNFKYLKQKESRPI